MFAPMSVILAAITAALVGFVGSIAVILKSAEALGATTLQTTSWITALCLGIALTSVYLTRKFHMPVITAWSTPGAALIASAGVNADLNQAVAAFLFASALIVVTMLLKPLSQLLKRLPVPLAAALLAGILLRFCMQIIEVAHISPVLVIFLVGLFFVLQPRVPALSVLLILIVGVIITYFLGEISSDCCTMQWPALQLIQPQFDMSVLLGLGLPLYLVTMTSQNLAGLAVLKADNYSPPPEQAIIPTGFVSLMFSVFAAHGVCLAAITTSICSSTSCHPNRGQRWKVGTTYALMYLLFALFSQTLVNFLLALPNELIITFVGLALFSPLMSSMKTALSGNDKQTRAALVTFIVTFSNLSLYGVDSALWGLLAGVLVLFMGDR